MTAPGHPRFPATRRYTVDNRRMTDTDEVPLPPPVLATGDAVTPLATFRHGGVDAGTGSRGGTGGRRFEASAEPLAGLRECRQPGNRSFCRALREK